MQEKVTIQLMYKLSLWNYESSRTLSNCNFKSITESECNQLTTFYMHNRLNSARLSNVIGFTIYKIESLSTFYNIFTCLKLLEKPFTR